jgi:glycerol kinase
MNYILSLDQGTTSSRAILYDEVAKVQFVAQQEFEQYYPKPGWVEHDPEDILNSQLTVAGKVLEQAGNDTAIACLGITNQRETTLLWDRRTGKPLYNAIVWQDRRTARYCESLKTDHNEELINRKTGLILDPYFSATKIHWILENVEGVREKANNGEVMFGTVDTWLIWHLTGGKLHATDVTNASRTMLYNIHTLEWDKELLALFNIPGSILPEVKDSADNYGTATINDRQIPIRAVAGDQQAALFGQLCIKKNMVKCTYGTGCFMVMNTGKKPVDSTHNLLTTIGWKINDKINYALEGSVFVGGAIIQWLRDELNFFDSSEQSESIAMSVADSNGVVFVPALTGLGAPYWDPSAKGTIFGITRGTNPAHITRAALESISLQVNDILEIMSLDSGKPIKELRVDGGATGNNLLMQLQADFSDVKVVRPVDQETTALGAAFLAGIAAGLWSIDELKENWQKDNEFKPAFSSAERNAALDLWKEAISRTKNWPNE